MKNFAIILFLGVFSPFLILGQQKPAYVLYNAQGKKLAYGKMIKSLIKQDVVLFGELHNNPICHWLELEVTKSCLSARELVLGAEMFEQDNQSALNLYLNGKMTEKGLDSAARLWKNYKTDYAPLVNLAKENKLKFIATNIPRKFASLVSKGGFESLDNLSADEKTWLAPLPILYDPELPGYVKMKTMMAEHKMPNMAKAQAIKDATMAYFIFQNQKPSGLFIHYNGSYHSEYFEGISWYLKKSNPNLRIATIASVSQDEINSLLPEHIGKADYIICVESDMTSTY
jgi:uncharacterized iron-regulated protein